MADQVTFKVHKYVKKLAVKIQAKLLKAGYPISEIAIYDIMAKRLEDEFEIVNWNNMPQVAKFVEGLIVDIEEVRKNNVTVKMRSIPRSEINVKQK